MKKLTKNEFRARGIFNSYEICNVGGGKVFLSYSTSGKCSPSKWAVVGRGFKTNPKSHWSNYGSQVFSGRMRSEALDLAKAWASEQYGIKEWVRDPWGGWQDAAAYKKAGESPIRPTEQPVKRVL